jgi:hypothetical protein
LRQDVSSCSTVQQQQNKQNRSELVWLIYVRQQAVSHKVVWTLATANVQWLMELPKRACFRLVVLHRVQIAGSVWAGEL